MIKRLCALASLLLIAILPTVVFAQASFTLPAVEIDLWPEYDDPGVLVIYHITLPGDVSLPAQFNLRIPAEAGAPNAVAARQPDGSLINASYQQKTSGAWNNLAITATTPELQVEYYDPNLKKDAQRRNYAFEWPGDYAVQALTVQVQQPAGASQVQISPDDFGSGTTQGDGLVYYTENIGPVPSGEPFKIQVSYDKASDDPTVKQLNPTLSPSSQPTSPTATTYLPWILGFMGLALIVGGVIWYLRSSNNSANTKARKRSRHRSAAKKEAAIADSEGYIYCAQCGKRAATGDYFCRTCGAELRH
jgi:hypothetical protein